MILVKHEPAGIGSPGFGHDALSGWSVGSEWHDVETGVAWRCRDNTPNKAKWYVIGAAKPTPSGSYDGPDWITGIADSSALQPDMDSFLPWTIHRRTPALSMLMVLMTLGSAGAAVRLGIYGSRYGLPVDLWKDFGEMALDSGGTGLREIINETVLEPGTWWLAANFKPVTTMPVIKRVSAAPFFGTPFFSSTSLTSGNANRGLFISRPYGPFPQRLTARPGDTNGGNIPVLGVRRT